MKNINEDTLTELLYSTDEENRKLGVSFIKNNFKYPKYTYYESNLVSQYFSFISQEKYKCRLTVDILLNNFININFSKEYIQSFINALIDYNEKYG